MHQKQLEAYRQELQRIYDETAKTLDDLESELSQSLRESTAELSAYDNHPADLASETYEREKDLGLREDQRRRLAEVDAALRRMAEGKFGFCTSCGHEIARERLAALPFAARCQSCQQQEENLPRARPIEEPMVAQLLQESFTDHDPADQIGFDGEDTWQAVARFGTSNTPGDFRQVEDYDEVYIDSDEPIGSVFAVDELPDQTAWRGRPR